VSFFRHFHPQPGREQQQATVNSGKGKKTVHKNAEPQYHHANQLDFIDPDWFIANIPG
jgi:hypothetical protein